MKKDNLIVETRVRFAKTNLVERVLGKGCFDGLNNELKEEIISCVIKDIENLQQRDREVLIKRFGLLDGNKLTQAECAKFFNITTSRVGQIENRAIRMLKYYNISKEESLESEKKCFEEIITEYNDVRVERLDLTSSQLNIFKSYGVYFVSDLLNFYFAYGKAKIQSLFSESSKTIIQKIESLENFETFKEKYMQYIQQKLDNKEYSLIQLSGIGVTTRTLNALRRTDINTIQDLVDFYKEKGIYGFQRIRSLGQESLKEILNLLEKYVGINALQTDEKVDTIAIATEDSIKVVSKISNSAIEDFWGDYRNRSIKELHLTHHQKVLLGFNNVNSVADLLKFYFTKGRIELEILFSDAAKTIIEKLESLDGFDVMKGNFMKQIKQKADNKEYSQIELGGLGLSVRTINALKRKDINTVQDLIDLYKRKGVYGILKIRNLGKTSLNEIADILQKYVGLKIIDENELTQ